MRPAVAVASLQTAMAAGRGISSPTLLALQRTLGNQTLQRLAQTGGVARVGAGLPGAGGGSARSQSSATVTAPSRARSVALPKLARLVVPEPAHGSENVRLVYPEPPAVQRLITAETFTAATYVGRTSVRGGTLTEIDQWLTEYHGLTAPPENSSQRDTLVAVLEEILDATAQWQEENADGTSGAVAKRTPGVKNLESMALAEKAKLEAVKFPEGQQAAVVAPDAKTKKVQDKLTGDFKQASERLAGLIDLAVPQADTTAEFEFDLAIPIPPSGVEIGFHLTMSAEKDDKNDVEVGNELGVTAGGSIGVAKLQGELGGFIEAKGGSGVEVMKLISYAMYQKFRESSVLPRELASYMWGGTMSRQGYKLAERWASKVEKGVLAQGTDDRERFVRRGAYASIKAEGGVTGGKLGGSAKARHFTEYNKESIEASIDKQTGGKKLDQLSVKELAALRMPKKRGARQSSGQTKMEGVLGFEAEFGPFAGSAEYTIGKAERELEISASAIFNLLELLNGEGIVDRTPARFVALASHGVSG